MSEIQWVQILTYRHGFRKDVEVAVRDSYDARNLVEYLQSLGVECRIRTRYLHDGEPCGICGREDLRHAL